MVEFKEIDINFPFEVGAIRTREEAYKFVDYLQSIGIKATAKPGFGASFTIYVAEEKNVEQAKLELLRFGNNPFAKAYNQAAWDRGRTIKREKTMDGGFLSFSLGTYRWTLLSLTSLIEVSCLLVYLLGFVPGLNNMFIHAFAWMGFEQIVPGLQIHRIFTPMFLHFGFLHIAFNLVMFEAFARPIERFFGFGKLLYIVLLIAAVSNTLQLIVAQHMYLFGGLSGVVYGVIGYMGVLSRREDLPSELKLPQGLLLVSFIFIGLGFFLEGIAALCHLGGILVGVALGFIDFKRPLKRAF